MRIVCTGAVLLLAAELMMGQTAAFKPPRLPDGKPNLNGIWQSIGTANWDITPHAATFGPIASAGEQLATPPGIGIIEGDSLPYLPEAAKQQKANYKDRLKLDPETKCYLPGVPRANYMPFPMQIVQAPDNVMLVYEYAGAVRTIPFKNPGPAPAPSWMGWSWARWDGDTLVVDATGFNDQTWFDRAGNFHSDALHVVERYTLVNDNALMYEATIEDPKVFSRPWKMSFPLYRRLEKNAQIMEFKCVEFVEELMYGHLRKGAQPAPAK